AQRTWILLHASKHITSQPASVQLLEGEIPMRKRFAFPRVVVCVLFAAAFHFTAISALAQEYKRVNLVSDIPGVALRADSHVVNCWGIAFFDTSPVWIANNGTGTATLYLGDGAPAPSVVAPLVVQIPRVTADTPAAPTGLVTNATQGFVVSENGKSG